MFRRFLTYVDKVLLGLCVAAFLASAVLAALRFQRLDEIQARNPAAGIAPVPYEVRPVQSPKIEKVSWPDSQPQSSGPEWLYDVFTPPVIYYNRETREFTVTPPAISAPVATRGDAPFEVDLIAVRQEPYRIQLRGYVENPDGGDPRGVFENVENGETRVGRQGQVFEAEQFTIQEFSIRMITTTTRDSMPVVEPVGVAIIRDERTGREETLTNNVTKMLPRLQAILRLRTNPPQDRVVREGGSVTVGGFSYLVTQLSLNPPQAVISRRAPDSLGALETRTLTPTGAGAGETRGSDILSFSSP